MRLAEGGAPNFDYVYEDEMDPEDKIITIAEKVYGADGVDFSPAAYRELRRIRNLEYGHLPICMAKTQYSLTDNPRMLGCPTGFWLSVREVILNAGAGFIVAVAGDIMRMPGLPAVPAAQTIDVDETGKIKGLF